MGWTSANVRASIPARACATTCSAAGSVLDPQTMEPVPQDGQTMGEIMFRGNIAMKGYLKNPQATEEAFRGGWFHTGDLAVQHPGWLYTRSRTAARTSSSRVARTSRPSRWKTCSTATLP